MTPDTHIIDCERCYRIATAIVEYQEEGVPPFALDIAQIARRQNAIVVKPPFALRADDFDHFVDRCCDGRPGFAQIKLVKAGSA